MRYSLLFFSLSLAILSTGCEKAVDIDTEKAAIIEVINRETETYLARDFESMFATHVQDSLNMRLTAGADNFVFAEGWEDVSRHMTGDETEDDLGPDLHISVVKSNYRMKLYPNSAFVVCDQKWSSDYGDDVTEIKVSRSVSWKRLKVSGKSPLFPLSEPRVTRKWKKPRSWRIKSGEIYQLFLTVTSFGSLCHNPCLVQTAMAERFILTAPGTI